MHEKFWSVCKNWSLFRAFCCLLFFTDNFDRNSLQFNHKLPLNLFYETRTPYEYKTNVKNLKINDRKGICSKSLVDFFIPKYSNFELFFYSVLKIFIKLRQTERFHGILSICSPFITNLVISVLGRSQIWYSNKNCVLNHESRICRHFIPQEVHW